MEKLAAIDEFFKYFPNMSMDEENTSKGGKKGKGGNKKSQFTTNNLNDMHKNCVSQNDNLNSKANSNNLSSINEISQKVKEKIQNFKTNTKDKNKKRKSKPRGKITNANGDLSVHGKMNGHKNFKQDSNSEENLKTKTDH